MTQEVWRPIPNWEGIYEVSDQGRVRSKTRTVVVRHPCGRDVARTYQGKTLSSAAASHGYLVVSFTAPGRQRETHCVHVLVARCFVKGRAPGLEVCHNDGNKMNCRAINLRWGTTRENAIDRSLHGQANTARGEKAGQAKLTNDAVLRIRAKHRAGETMRALGRKHGVAHRTIGDVVHGRSWAHV